MPASLFRAVDADHDGTLSGEEISAAPAAIKSLDKDGDGVVTAAEVAPQAGKQAQPGKKKKAGRQEARQGQEEGQPGSVTNGAADEAVQGSLGPVERAC